MTLALPRPTARYLVAYSSGVITYLMIDGTADGFTPCNEYETTVPVSELTSGESERWNALNRQFAGRTV